MGIILVEAVHRIAAEAEWVAGVIFYIAKTSCCVVEYADATIFRAYPNAPPAVFGAGKDIVIAKP